MLHEGIKYPQMVKVSQTIETPRINDIPGTVEKELQQLALKGRIFEGASIAVTAGSRGISQIPVILKSAIDYLKKIGAKPFIIPSMGSHGGATAEGQLKVLERLGITEETMGVPIISSMDVVQIGETGSGDPVYMDVNAWKADGIIAINRIKTHTAMSCAIESGLLKMISVGLGKEKGCSLIHSLGLGDVIQTIAREVLKSDKIIGGLAIIENAREEIAEIVGVKPEQMAAVEKELLIKSKALMPGLPFKQIDLLIVEEIGKNISGTGMDTNITGRFMLPHLQDPPQPRVEIITVLDLSKETGGNAMGIGLADITTRKLVDKIDYQATYKNVIAAGFLNRAKIPITMENDQKAIELALKTAHCSSIEEAKVVRIHNTLELNEMMISQSLIDEAREASFEIKSPLEAMSFNDSGDLV